MVYADANGTTLMNLDRIIAIRNTNGIAGIIIIGPASR